MTIEVGLKLLILKEDWVDGINACDFNFHIVEDIELKVELMTTLGAQDDMPVPTSIREHLLPK
jgi:hypothetical protein